MIGFLIGAIPTTIAWYAFIRLWGVEDRLRSAEARVEIGHRIIDEQQAEITELLDNQQPRDSLGRFGSKGK